ncbi:MAG: cysteine desulfurase NifS [Candidatus Abyssobacteria bacterium SURF_17]|uniref:Cysteine desulfurase IscS n=1 Tax=Candidatus Abyssobacteria bacterium SURF_17 TaxID=2093361 RepID=A0A419ERB7_9BACT|nr:MAG: cysteine desulfurase NifS [Candidatus Abyssubacteria bacterium SURF_17]
MKRIYLDHNATTPMNPEVLKAMLPFFTQNFGNASSIHNFGREAREAISKAREQVAALIEAEPANIVFTSGGTESDNFAIKGIAYANEKKGKHIITSQIEHPAVLSTCKFLEKQGFEVTYLKVDNCGKVDLDQLRDSIRKDTILISIMHGNNEIGTIQDIEEIGKIAAEKGVFFHTDAVQTCGKIPVSVKRANATLLSLSGHKIYGPKGVGALFIKKATRIFPLQHGGHHESNRRAGTENVPGIVGLGKACEIAQKSMEGNCRRIVDLRNRLQNELVERIEDTVVNGHPTDRLPNTLNICFRYVEGESMIMMLDMKGIAVSSGSACTSGSLDPSHVLLAIGLSHEIAHGSLRFSLGVDNTREDIDYVAEVMPEIVHRLRKMSALA